MMKKPRSLRRTMTYVVLIVVGLLVYAYGWQATDINLDRPQDEERQKIVVQALRGLLNPDLVERDTESEFAYAHFLVPCTGTSPAQPEVEEGAPYIRLTPDCGEEKELTTIEVFNFRPYSDGYIRWTPPGRSKLPQARFRTDGDGYFLSTELRVPTASESDELQVIEVEVRWPVGAPRPSEALQVTIERMIETVFLALMATTLALLVAIPVSFLAAFNLMRPIRKPLGSLLAMVLPLLLWALATQSLGAQEASTPVQDWLTLRPLIDWGLSFGNSGWPGVGALLALAAGLYLVARFIPQPRAFSSPLLAGAVRYSRMVLLAVLLLAAAAVTSGLGTQFSLGLGDFLGGVLSSVVGTAAEFLTLLLPTIGGLALVFILGSVFGVLVRASVDRIVSQITRRALGLLLGASAGGLLCYLVYTGVFNFYNPRDPMPLVTQLTVAGSLLGGGLGVVLGPRHSMPLGLVVYYGVRTILNALRSIEPLIMGIVFVIWGGIGPFAGVLALTLHSIAALGKLYSEQVESIDPGPIEAITATGATRLQMIVYGVVPQIVPPYIAFTLYRWDINVRMSTIIGFVGGGGIGFILQQWINLLRYREAGVAVLAIAIVVAALDYVSAKAREKIT